MSVSKIGGRGIEPTRGREAAKAAEPKEGLFARGVKQESKVGGGKKELRNLAKYGSSIKEKGVFNELHLPERVLEKGKPGRKDTVSKLEKELKSATKAYDEANQASSELEKVASKGHKTEEKLELLKKWQADTAAAKEGMDTAKANLEAFEAAMKTSDQATKKLATNRDLLPTFVEKKRKQRK